MNKVLLLLSCLVSCLAARQAHATNFYVSNNGNDAGSGTSPANPWATIARVNSNFHNFRAGDSILFRRGDHFTGELVITASGSPSEPIVLGAYGTGERPVISGFTTLTAWTPVGRGVYSSPCPLCKATDNVLVINGQQHAIGRYPNSGYITVEHFSTNTYIVDTTLTGKPDWTGAELVLKKSHYVIDRNKITSQSGDTIRYKSGSVYPYSMDDNYGYFIQNDPRTLDAFGEWYLDPVKKDMEVFWGNTKPGSNTVQTSVVDTLVYINHYSYITFANIAFEGANASAIWSYHALNIAVLGCSIDFSGTNAITSVFCGNLKVINTSINHSNNDALNIAGTKTYAHADIASDTIRNTGIIEGMALNGDGACDAIHDENSLGDIIERNVIDSTGYNGILFSSDSVLVKDNYLTNFLLIKGDGGGIYTYSGPKTPIYQGRKIVDNVILDGVGPYTPNVSNWHNVYHGIYIDGYSPNVDVIHNTVSNCKGSGIRLNLYSKNIKVLDNTVYNCGSQILITKDSILPNFVIKNNVLVSKTTGQYVLNVECMSPQKVAPGQLGIIDSNYYFKGAADTNDVFIVMRASAARYSLGSWRNASGKDNASGLGRRRSAVETTGGKDLLFKYNPTGEPQKIALDGGYRDVKNRAYANSITLAPYSSVVLIKGGASSP